MEKWNSVDLSQINWAVKVIGNYNNLLSEASMKNWAWTKGTFDHNASRCNFSAILSHGINLQTVKFSSQHGPPSA